MVPQYIIVKGLGLYNTHTSLILIQAFSAFGVFLLRQNMLSIPDSLHEAAKIDGCVWFPTFEEIADYMTKEVQPGDLVITLGCGDVYKCARMMIAKRKELSKV